jgi:hypothetical protein
MEIGVSPSNSIDKNSKDLKVFAFLMAGLAFLLSKGLGTTWIVSMLIGLVFPIMAFLAPVVLIPFYRLWVKFGGLLHLVMTPLILGVVYFGVFTPIALIFKLMRRDALSRRMGQKDSYWEPYDSHESTLERYRRLY